MNPLWLLTALPAAWLLRRSWWLKDIPGLPVLVYHKIGNPPPDSSLKDLWVTPENFEKQVIWLKEKGYETISFSRLASIHKEGKPLNGNEILITFDDGYENNYRYAWPILAKHKSIGNIFVVYNTIGKTNIWHNPKTEPWIDMADEKMLLEMQESGWIEFGSHTMNHPKLTQIPYEDAVWEIRESKKQLEGLLKKEMTAFAYPYGLGAYDEKIRKAVLDAGYVLDFSFTQGKTSWPWQRESKTIDRLFIKKNENLWDLSLHIKKGKSKVF
ncbi:MAG: polysaccharide deacetylase family protein [Elusimicrobiota bacterium]